MVPESPTDLTPAQYRVLEWIELSIATNGSPPTYEEIRAGLGYRSKSPVQQKVVQLIDKGYLSHTPRKAKSLKVLISTAQLRGEAGHNAVEPASIQRQSGRCQIPLLGTIAAHSLVTTSPVELQMIDVSSFPKLSRLSEYALSQHFALRVWGDSMTGANIQEGDVVVLRKDSNNPIKEGQIIAARVGDSTTLKHYYRHQGWVTLSPANPIYSPSLIAATELVVEGLYTGILLRGI